MKRERERESKKEERRKREEEEGREDEKRLHIDKAIINGEYLSAYHLQPFQQNVCGNVIQDAVQDISSSSLPPTSPH